MAEVLSWWPAYLLAWIGVWLYGRHVSRAWARETIRRRDPAAWAEAKRRRREMKYLDEQIRRHDKANRAGDTRAR